MIYKGLVFVSMLFLTACGSTPPVMSGSRSVGTEPVKGAYYANYNYTWQTTLQEMQRFNLKIVNQDSGIILTEDMLGYSGHDIRSQYRYYFDVRVEALPAEGTVPITQVSVTKFIFKNQGVIQEKEVKSNFIDERVILYRIKRLLEIERKKLERTGNQNTTLH